MTSKDAKSIKRKPFSNKSMNKLKHYFQYQEVIEYTEYDYFPTEPPKSPDNLMTMFRTMWTINMLLKNTLNKNTATETSGENRKNTCVDSTVKTVYKTIWKLKYT